MVGIGTDIEHPEEKYSESLLRYLDDLMVLFEKVETKNFSVLQQKILIQNLFRNISDAINKYFSLQIQNSELYQSVLVQTTTVLKAVSSQLERTDDLMGLKKELNTKIHYLIIRIINTRSIESYSNAITTSHFVGEFLNDLEVVVFYPKPPLPNSDTYYENVMHDFDYFHSMALVYARPILQLKLLPREWVSSWGKTFYLHISYLIDYIRDIKLRKFISSSLGKSTDALRKFLDLYILLAILTYKLHSIDLSNFREILQPLNFSGENTNILLESVFKYSSEKITHLMEVWTGLGVEIQQEDLYELDQLNEYGFMVGKSLLIISQSLQLLNDIKGTGYIRMSERIEHMLSSIRSILTYFQIKSEFLSTTGIILRSEIREINHIIFGIFCSLLYYKICSTLNTANEFRYLDFLKDEIVSMDTLPRSLLLFYLLRFSAVLKTTNGSFSDQLENLQTLITRMSNPLDEISARFLHLLILQQNGDEHKIEQEMKLIENICNSQVGISHLQVEMGEFIESLKEPEIFKFKVCYQRINRRIVSDPFSLIKPGWDGEINPEKKYVPFNLETDFVLFQEFFA